MYKQTSAMLSMERLPTLIGCYNSLQVRVLPWYQHSSLNSNNMERINYQQNRPSDDLDVKSILLQLAFGALMGLAFIAVCGFGELVADYFNK